MSANLCTPCMTSLVYVQNIHFLTGGLGYVYVGILTGPEIDYKKVNISVNL